METTTTVNFNVIEAITKLGVKLQHSKLLKTNLRSSVTITRKLCKYFDISEEECYFLVIVFVAQMQDDELKIREFQRFTCLSAIEALRFRETISKLETKGYLKSMYLDSDLNIRTFFSGKNSYELASEVVDAIYKNKPIDLTNIKNEIDIFVFISEVSYIIAVREDSSMGTGEMFDWVEELEKNNPHLTFIEKLKTSLYDIDDRTLLYEMADDFTKVGYSGLNSTFKSIYKNMRERMTKAKCITDKTSMLINADLITIGNAIFHNDIKIQLTDKAIELIFGEDAQLFARNKSFQNLLTHDKIDSKSLYYDEELQKQVDFISRSLVNSNFSNLQQRLESQKLSRGVAAVFYGAPGTGKTETAYQIAKLTGRDVMFVDLSETKSMWFGESEKQVKEIFTNYKKACRKNQVKPILLFNEADGVMSKRSDNRRSSVDQTLNTIQNILLEEFEKNEGIIIATTNLVDNLDSAFERRFLFKVQFEKPSYETKRQIWKSKLEWLDDKQLDELAGNFSLSGGEIDNIVRKVIMDEILLGERPAQERITELCRNEKLYGAKGERKLGYV
jgi:hypothetical protein